VFKDVEKLKNYQLFEIDYYFGFILINITSFSLSFFWRKTTL